MKPRYITLPENWDELTHGDWRELLKMRQEMIRLGKQVTIEDVRIETARMLLKNRGVKVQLNNQNYLLLISQLAEGLGWLWQVSDEGISLVYKSADNKLPKVREWLGPMPYAADMTFGEFRTAVAVLKNYEKQPTEEGLNMLAGLLYRPEASRRVQRERQVIRDPYDWDGFEDKIKRGAKMQRWQVWGIYTWFAYFCEYLTTGVFTLDGEEICFAPLFSSNEKGGMRTESSNAGDPLLQICYTLAESHVFGTAKEVDNTLLFDVMRKLLQDYYSLQRLKNVKSKKSKP